MTNQSKIASQLSIDQKQVGSVVQLLDGGATVPFISRYRKEMTGSLDEVAITAIRDLITKFRDLDKRREAIIASLEKQEILTQELKRKVENAESMVELEDIYLPYKPKRKTKASMAKEKGLEPLAKLIFEQKNSDVSLFASEYINEHKQVHNEDEALQGARDIIAEWVNESQEVRGGMRKLFFKEGVIKSKVIKGKEQEGHKYKDYFEWEEPIIKVPSHRMLAMRRGEKEMILSLDIGPEVEVAITRIEKNIITANNEASEQVKIAIVDCYKRLLKPSMETEVRLGAKADADEVAIKVFSSNLKKLLLAAPLGQKNILAIDPGFRTGCKVVCMDKQGKLLHNETIFPNEPQKQIAKSAAAIEHLCKTYNVEVIAIGNGTAGRETERFVKNIGLNGSIMLVMVNESGASVYSASEVARDEFPNHDITVRGAVSIGRRLMDPLAELVKLDPKSIGVGQYQHDVDQNQLKAGLDDVVMSCVNSVGVEVNTASKQLLSYVSGLGPQLAKSIVEYRDTHGPFKRRAALSKVPRLGDKAFEQSAGFLRIMNAANPLDSSAVHPESYNVVKKMAKDQQCEVNDLMKDQDVRASIKLANYTNESIGLPTLKDIMEELHKPGRDPRDQFEAFTFQEGVNSMEDLKAGMQLPGVVTNVTNFGAFVDIGVHQDGLVHISHLSDNYVSAPDKVVSVQQHVQVTVMEVDINRKRISLSMKGDPFGKQSQKREERKREQTSDGDMQSKLNLLKGKFRK